MWEVIDLTYTEEEGQSCFSGTYKECQEWYEQQCEASQSNAYTLKVVPVISPIHSTIDGEDYFN